MKDFDAYITLKKHFETYYSSLSEGQAKGKVAYVSAMAPVELLKSLGFKLFFPENHAALIAARKQENDYIPFATNIAGFSHLSCSYTLSDIGADIAGTSPIGREIIPKPDLLVCNSSQCLDIKYWFKYYADKYNVPYLEINVPHSIPLDIEPVFHFVEKQLVDLITDIERIFHVKFSQDRLNEYLHRSNECTHRWKQVIDYGKLFPSPINMADECIFMAMAVLLRGDQVAIDFYDQLLAELEECYLSHSKEEPIQRYRLYWCGMPIWGALRYLSTTIQDLNACLVGSVYTSSWLHTFDLNNPLYSMAKTYSTMFINLTEEAKLDYLINTAKEFSVDGFLFHHSLSCKRNSDNYYGLSNMLKDKTGLPSITFEADHSILERFDKKRFRILLEALLDQIDCYKGINAR